MKAKFLYTVSFILTTSPASSSDEWWTSTQSPSSSSSLILALSQPSIEANTNRMHVTYSHSKNSGKRFYSPDLQTRCIPVDSNRQKLTFILLFLFVLLLHIQDFSSRDVIFGLEFSVVFYFGICWRLRGFPLRSQFWFAIKEKQLCEFLELEMIAWDFSWWWQQWKLVKLFQILLWQAAH